MAFYSDMANEHGPGGEHYFDAGVILLLGGTTVVKRADPSGSVCDIIIASRRAAADVLLHRNGREGSTDVARDTVVIPLTKLVQFDDAQQATLLQYEQIPPALNPANPGRRPGVVTPPRSRGVVEAVR